MADSTIDTIKKRPQSIDDQVDSALGKTTAPVPIPQAPQSTPSESPHNTGNRLPESESVFHRIVRGFTGK